MKDKIKEMHETLVYWDKRMIQTGSEELQDMVSGLLTTYEQIFEDELTEIKNAKRGFKT